MDQRVRERMSCIDENPNGIEDGNMILSGNHLLEHGNILAIAGRSQGESEVCTNFILPNLFQAVRAGSSFVVTDSTDYYLDRMRGLLEDKGYRIEVIDLSVSGRHERYDPFRAIRDPDGVTDFADCMVWNSREFSGDLFFRNLARIVLCAFVGIIIEKKEKKEPFSYIRYRDGSDILTEDGFGACMELIRLELEEGNDRELVVREFNKWERKFPDSLACRYYSAFQKGGGKITKRGILISCAGCLKAFALDGTGNDPIHLEEIGNEPVAVFVISSFCDMSNYGLIVSLYAQFIRAAESDQTLPFRLFLPDMAGFCLPPQIFGTDSHGVSVICATNAIQPLKTMYGDEWERIMNYSAIIYFDSSDMEACRFICNRAGAEMDEIFRMPDGECICISGSDGYSWDKIYKESGYCAREPDDKKGVNRS